MKAVEINRLAQSYHAAHGDAAEAEVAQKAVDAEAAGDIRGADHWRAVREAIRELRSAHQG